MTLPNHSSTPAWLEDAVFYEIYPQSWLDTNGDGIGDLPGVTARLDYVKSLGATAIWLNPCWESPFLDAGYDVADYYKVAPRYGTNDDLKQLFVEAHKRGLRILLDLVVGHTSIQNAWFIRVPASQSATSTPIGSSGMTIPGSGTSPVSTSCTAMPTASATT